MADAQAQRPGRSFGERDRRFKMHAARQHDGRAVVVGAARFAMVVGRQPSLFFAQSLFRIGDAFKQAELGVLVRRMSFGIDSPHVVGDVSWGGIARLVAVETFRGLHEQHDHCGEVLAHAGIAESGSGGTSVGASTGSPAEAVWALVGVGIIVALIHVTECGFPAKIVVIVVIGILVIVDFVVIGETTIAEAVAVSSVVSGIGACEGRAAAVACEQ